MQLALPHRQPNCRNGRVVCRRRDPTLEMLRTLREEEGVSPSYGDAVYHHGCVDMHAVLELSVSNHGQTVDAPIDVLLLAS